MPRNTQTYNHANTFITGLLESRMTASSTPSTDETTMAMSVITRVSTTPERMRRLNRNSVIVGW